MDHNPRHDDHEPEDVLTEGSYFPPNLPSEPVKETGVVKSTKGITKSKGEKALGIGSIVASAGNIYASFPDVNICDCALCLTGDE